MPPILRHISTPDANTPITTLDASTTCAERHLNNALAEHAVMRRRCRLSADARAISYYDDDDDATQRLSTYHSAPPTRAVRRLTRLS